MLLIPASGAFGELFSSFSSPSDGGGTKQLAPPPWCFSALTRHQLYYGTSGRSPFLKSCCRRQSRQGRLNLQKNAFNATTVLMQLTFALVNLPRMSRIQMHLNLFSITLQPSQVLIFGRCFNPKQLQVLYMFYQFLHSLRMRKYFEIASPMLYTSYYVNTNVIPSVTAQYKLWF